ncbi:hypothetical protein EI94DRAFT_615456 [Lactarius quietus]|nr:hypothetical protein EI94DRAFT_615456 [Lactarius quietus]
MRCATVMRSLWSEVPCGHLAMIGPIQGTGGDNDVHIRATFLFRGPTLSLRLTHPYSTMEDPSEELPDYSPNQGHPRADTARVEHRYALQDKNSRDWLSFRVRSRATSSKHTPLYLEGDIIKGEIRLDLAKAETLKGLTVTLCAGMTTVGQNEEVFLDKTEPVWTPASSQEGKVVGVHTHAFSISIPRDAVLVSATPQRFSLPPTFTERASPAYIDYKLYVTVRRGGLRMNNRLSMSFAFVPRTVADPPSPLRALVYSEGGMILGPDADPQGWKVFDPIKITGTLFNVRDVTVQHTVSGLLHSGTTPLIYQVHSLP